MSDDEDHNEFSFKINEEYASRYNKWREKEELQKLKDRYGDEDEEDSETSEDEDEDAEGLTPQLEKDFYRTLAAIKSKDPRIYNKDVQFFHSTPSDDEEDKQEISTEQKKKVKEKPMFLKDYEREIMLKKGGLVGEYEEKDPENDGSGDDDEYQNKPGYFEEQEEIKKSLKNALAGSDSDDELLTKRTKTKEQLEKEEEDYLEWLKGHKNELSNDKEVGIELEPLKEYYQNPDLPEDQKFLRDFLLNKRYLDDDDNDRIPTYEEITKEEDLSEEEKELEKQELFEHKFNFRYEEPDKDFIKSYPRTIGDSLRRKDSKRSEHRKEVKQRKEMEKEKKKEELKQLKNLKKREIQSKLEQLREITGNKEVGFDENDLEGDFDPDAHDKLMQKIIDEDYYEEEEGEIPNFIRYDEDDENWDDWTGAEGDEAYGDEEQPNCDDPDFNMDADYDPQAAVKEELNFGKKKKKKSIFKDALKRKKPVLEEGQEFEEYFEQYYNLNFEDIIGDQPCRFKYRQTVPNDFGLTVGEILSSKDKELNQWVSVKRMSQFRTEEEEKFDVKIFRKKGNSQKKYNIMRSLVEKDEESKPAETITQNTAGSRKKKRKLANSDVKDSTNKKPKLEASSDLNTETIIPAKEGGKIKKKKKAKLEALKNKIDILSNLHETPKTETSCVLKTDSKSPNKGNIKTDKKKKKKKKMKQKSNEMSDERLKAYGINPKKFKYTHMKKTNS